MPRHGLVLAASQATLDIRKQIDQMAKGIGADIRKIVEDEVQQGISEVRAAVTGEISVVSRDIREQVTRRVTDLIPGNGKGVLAQFRAHVALREVAKTDTWVEYQDSVELSLRRAQRHARGAWRALNGITQVLGDLVNASAGTDYVAVSFETSDGRGIEVAFLYDDDRVDLLDAFQLSGPDVDAAFGPSSASPGRDGIGVIPIGLAWCVADECGSMSIRQQTSRGDGDQIDPA